MNINVYTASQEVEKAAKSASVTSVITAKQLKQWGVLDLYEALSFLPGIVKNETYMGYSVLTFRGVTPGLFNNKALFMINGHPVYENLFGSSHLEYIPVDMVERIEVVRNPASVLYGTQASSGVVNVITRQNSDNQLAVRAGSNNHGMASVSYFDDKLSMGASLQRDDGYPFTGTNDEFGNPVDFDYQDDYQNIFVDMHQEDWRINGAYYKQDSARYGFNPWVWLNGINETESYYLDLNKNFDMGTGELNIWLRLDNMDKNYHAGQFPFPADCSSYNNIPTLLCNNTNQSNLSDTTTDLFNTIKRQTLEVQFKERVSDQLSYIAGGSIENAETTPLTFIYLADGSINPNAGFPDSHVSKTAALYGQLKYSINENLDTIFGLRAEKNDDAGYSGAVPRIGVTYQIQPDIYLKALYSEAYRTPVFIEKYAYTPNFLFGDINLEREKIQTLELGVDATINNTNTLQIALYQLHLKNEITRRPSIASPPASEYYNAEGRIMHGVEFDWKSIVSDKLELILNSAYMTGEDETQKELQPTTVSDAPFIANTTLNLVITYKINNNWSSSLSNQYVGSKEYVLSNNTEGEIDAYNISNLVIQFKKNQHAVDFKLRNIFDEEYIYPEPVRRNITGIPGGSGVAGYLQYTYNY